ILDRVASAAGGHLSSIAADRLAGRPTEWDARNGVVGRIATRHGIDVPLNEWLTALIRLGEPEVD
ncbi:MAG: ketopantoate reductase C-terminal domain-containing protein, partial [Acidimicrobiales bacterium]